MARKKQEEKFQHKNIQKVTKVELRPGVKLHLAEKGWSEAVGKDVPGCMLLELDMRELKGRDSALVVFHFDTRQAHNIAAKINSIVK